MLDISAHYELGNKTVYVVFHEMCLVLDKVLHFPKLPKTEAELTKVAQSFKVSRKAVSPLDGCVGALDGICIKIAKPDKANNPAFFYCRKGFYFNTSAGSLRL